MVSTPPVQSTAGHTTWLIVCLLVILYTIADLLFNIWTFGTPLVVFLSFLMSAATITALFRPLIGAVLAVVPMLADLVIPFDFGGPPLIIVTLMIAATAPLRIAVPVILAFSGLRIAHLIWWSEGSGRGTAFMSIFVVSLAVGLAGRWLIGHARRTRNELTRLDERVQAVRLDEREALADELSGVLADDLRATGILLDRAMPGPASLNEVGERARSSLTRLRRLVSTLRTAPDDPQDSGDLLGALEETEDLLVGHGFPVELEVAEATTLPAEFDTKALFSALRDATDHIRTHYAGGIVHIGIAATNDGATLTVAHREEDSDSPGWSRTSSLPARANQTPTPTAPPRRPLLTRINLTTIRLALTVPAAITALWWLPSLLDRSRTAAETGIGLAWLTTFMAWALASWMPRASVLLMAATALTTVQTLPAPAAFAPLDLLGIFTAAVVAANWPRALPVVPLGVFVSATWWYRDIADPFPLFATTLFTVVGMAAGLGVRHFLRLRTEHIAEYKHLLNAYNTARGAERTRLAGELHDIVAHQLSLMTMVLMAHGTSQEPADLAATQERLRHLNASAEADLATLVNLTRHGPARETDAGVAPARAAKAVAATLNNSGYIVDLDLTTALDDPDPTHQRTLSRILREATTNILRYAPHGTAVGIRLSSSASTLDLTITNRLPASPRPSHDSTGFGLIGLTERTALTGGTFSAGAFGDHWVVTASLPQTPAPRSACAAGRGPAMVQPPSGGSRRGSTRPI